MQGRPPVFLCSEPCIVQRIKRKTVTTVRFYQNKALRCYTSAGQVET